MIRSWCSNQRRGYEQRRTSLRSRLRVYITAYPLGKSHTLHNFIKRTEGVDSRAPHNTLPFSTDKNSIALPVMLQVFIICNNQCPIALHATAKWQSSSREAGTRSAIGPGTGKCKSIIRGAIWLEICLLKRSGPEMSLPSMIVEALTGILCSIHQDHGVHFSRRIFGRRID
jgi:hypothetical protein